MPHRGRHAQATTLPPLVGPRLAGRDRAGGIRPLPRPPHHLRSGSLRRWPCHVRSQERHRRLHQRDTPGEGASHHGRVDIACPPTPRCTREARLCVPLRGTHKAPPLSAFATDPTFPVAVAHTPEAAPIGALPSHKQRGPKSSSVPPLPAHGPFTPAGNNPGLRAGLGTGLRLDLRVAVLRFDWAYGFGNAATGGSRGKFYFNVILPTH